MTSQDPLIGGLISGGSGQANAELVVRAIGPSLQQFGVTGLLNDPALEVRDSQGELVAANNDWETNEEQFRGSAVLHALRPRNERESALRISLPVGAYTALVRGQGNSNGVALVEVYDLRR
ncbi:MAG TPA: hypothetical protein VG095_00060 [Chthoniobacterales bacterium]|nr:hypothetical protein [Chthoniobacterales bacterium]